MRKSFKYTHWFSAPDFGKRDALERYYLKKYESVRDQLEIEDSKYYKSVFVTTLGVFLVIAFVLVSTFYYPKTDLRIANHQHSLDLKQNGLQTKYKIGKSPTCEQGIDCWVQSNFDDSKWDEASFPKEYLSSLNGYKLEEDNWIYYRLHLQIPEDLANSNKEISFTPTYIFHSYYEVYVKDNLITTGNVEGFKIKSINIPIARKYLDSNNSATLVIKGKLTQGSDIGMSHRGTWILGEERVLHDIVVHGERAMSTFYSNFIVFKSAIFAVFCLFYLIGNYRKHIFNFLVFGLLTMLESLFISDFLATWIESLDVRITLALIARTMSYSALVCLFLNMFNFKKIPQKYWIYLGGLVVAIVPTYMYLNRFPPMSVVGWSYVPLILTLLVLIFIGIMSLKHSQYFKDRKHYLTIKKLLNMSLFLYLIGISFLTYEAFFVGYSGFDLRPLLDIAIFLVFAGITYYHYITIEKDLYAARLVVKRKSETINLYAETLEKEVLENETLALEAKTEIHDNKHLSVTVLNILDNIQSNGEYEKNMISLRDIATKNIARADRALNSLEYIGNIKKNLDKKSVSLMSIVRNGLVSAIRTKMEPEIQIYTELSHKHDVNVDSAKIEKVFQNIVENAIDELKKYRQKMLIVGADSIKVNGNNFVKVFVKNTSEPIPEKDLENIFEPGVTRNKEHGSGYGLYYCKRTIEAHNGTIQCENKDGFVIFSFTIPAGKDFDENLSKRIPNNSSEIIDAINKSIHKQSEKELEDEAIKNLSRRKSPFKVAVLDSEDVYYNSIVDIFSYNLNLSKYLNFIHIKGEGYKELGELGIELVLVDLDFQDQQNNGLVVGSEIKKLFPNLRVVIGTSESIEEIDRSEYGIDDKILKPFELFDVLEQVMIKLKSSENEEPQNTSSESSIMLVVCDDDPIFLAPWMCEEGIEAKVFSSPEDLMRAINEDQFDIKKIDAFVLDNNFNTSELKGIELAEILKNDYQVKSKVFLCTSGYSKKSEYIDQFLSKVMKDAVETIKKYFEK